MDANKRNEICQLCRLKPQENKWGVEREINPLVLGHSHQFPSLTYDSSDCHQRFNMASLRMSDWPQEPDWFGRSSSSSHKYLRPGAHELDAKISYTRPVSISLSRSSAPSRYHWSISKRQSNGRWNNLKLNSNVQWLYHWTCLEGCRLVARLWLLRFKTKSKEES